MSLTPEERQLLDQRENLTHDERGLIAQIYGSAVVVLESREAYQAPHDDRAAKFEAALVRFLLDSRKPAQPATAGGPVYVPELAHDAMMLKEYNVQLGPVQRRERRIVAYLCAHLMARGFRIHGLYDGEEWYSFAKEADPVKAAMEIIFNLDECSLRIASGGTGPDGEPEHEHGIWLILGNGEMGNDMIADWNYTEGDPDGFSAAMDAFDTEQVP